MGFLSGLGSAIGSGASTAGKALSTGAGKVGGAIKSIGGSSTQPYQLSGTHGVGNEGVMVPEVTKTNYFDKARQYGGIAKDIAPGGSQTEPKTTNLSYDPVSITGGNQSDSINKFNAILEYLKGSGQS